MSVCELTVRGGLVDSVIELISSRFGNLTVHHEPGQRTTVTVEGVDPAGERALLNLLWDTGHDVVGMRSHR